MLVLKCSGCKRKLWKYEKIGMGEVLRCHKDRISIKYNLIKTGSKVLCKCGKEIGVDRGRHIKMISNAFTYRGTKQFA